jgi:hypothetical protein
MDTETYDALVAGGDPLAVVQRLEALTPAQRRALSTHANRVLSAVRKTHRGERCAAVGVLATGTWTTAKRVRPEWGSRSELLIRAAALDRPAWLGKWLHQAMQPSRRDAPTLDYRTVRPFVRDGTYDPVALGEEAYLRALAAFRGHALAALLDADPVVLDEELWRMLACDAHPFSADPSTPEGPNWTNLLRTHAASGRIDRARLLDTVLGRMVLLPRVEVQGWVHAHTRLAPTAAEQRRLEPRYLDLLACEHGPVRSLALAALRGRDDLDQPGFLAAVPAVFAHRDKGTAMAALRLLGRLPTSEAVARALLGALLHPRADVVEAALDRLEQQPLDALVDDLAVAVDDVPASLAPRLRALVGAAAPRVAEASEGPVSRSFLAEPVAPIDDLDTLVTTLRAALDRVDGETFDRLVDGIARLGPTLTDAGDHAALVAELHDDERWGLSDLVAWLGRRWLVGPEAPPMPEEVSWSLARFRRAWVVEVADGLSAARQLLSTPTHAGGWIDPRVFAARWTGDHGPYDVVAALLRLAPEHREAALAAIPDAPAEVRYALGADGLVGDSALWRAACAARGERPVFTWGSGAVPTGWGTSRVAVGASPVDAPPRAPDAIEATWLAQQHLPSDWAAMGWGQGFDHLASVWPGNPEPGLALAVSSLALALERPSDLPERVLLEPMFHPGQRWTELADVAVALALLSKSAGSRALAVDLLHAAILDGRVGEPTLAGPLGTLLAGGHGTHARLGPALAEVMRGGTRHAEVVAGVLDGVVAALPAEDRQLHHLLTPLLEAVTVSGRAVEASREVLGSIGGSGKAAKLAAKVLALTPR